MKPSIRLTMAAVAFALANALAAPAWCQASGPAASSVELGMQSGQDRHFNPLSSLQFTGSQANSTATATLQLPEISGLSGSASKTGTYSADGFAASVALSTPISKGSDSTNLATLSGFANSTNLTFQVSGYHGSGLVPFGQYSQPAQDFCKETAKSLIPQYNAAHADKPFAYDNPKYCTDIDLQKLNAKDADRLRFGAFAAPPSPLILYGLSGTVGYEQHTFYDSTSLAKTTADKVPVGVGGYVTWVTKSRDLSLTGQIDYQRAYTDSASKILCPAGSAPVTCVNGSIGAPTATTKVLLAVEARAFESWSNFIPMGVAPMFTFDAKSHAYAFDVPVYLYSDGKNGLTGGVRADWTSVKHRVIFGVFVTKAFDVGGHTTPSP